MTLDDLVITSEGLCFPRFGSYYLQGTFGAFKTLLIDPAASAEDQLIELGGFISECSWHSAIDTHLCFEHGKRAPILLPKIIDKLFHSDQPVGLWCTQLAHVLAYLLRGLKIEARMVSFRNDQNVGHSFLEALVEPNGWYMVDPDFGVMLRHNEKFLSAAEILALRAAGKADEIEIFRLAAKPFPRPEFNFPMHFHGQMTWRPEYMKYPADIAPYYRHVVIDRGYSGDLRYFKYHFKSEPCESLAALEIVDRAGH